MKLKTCNRAIITTSVLGVLVSTYALYVEMAAEARPGYKALCDISERASCSRVLTSEYSKGFGMVPKDSALEIPNCIYGIAFYCLIIILTTYDHPIIIRLQLLLALSSIASSVYLAYLLAFVLNDLCVVCVSTYFINGFITAFVYSKKEAVELEIVNKKEKMMGGERYRRSSGTNADPQETNFGRLQAASNAKTTNK